jgi:hypothetical protein
MFVLSKRAPISLIGVGLRNWTALSRCFVTEMGRTLDDEIRAAKDRARSVEGDSS